MDENRLEKRRERLTVWVLGCVLFAALLAFGYFFSIVTLGLIPFGVEGVVKKRLRVTNRRDVRGRRARALGAALLLYCTAFLVLAFLDRMWTLKPLDKLMDRLVGAPLWFPFLVIWILGLAWSKSSPPSAEQVMVRPRPPPRRTREQPN